MSSTPHRNLTERISNTLYFSIEKHVRDKNELNCFEYAQYELGKT